MRCRAGGGRGRGRGSSGGRPASQEAAAAAAAARREARVKRRMEEQRADADACALQARLGATQHTGVCARAAVCMCAHGCALWCNRDVKWVGGPVPRRCARSWLPRRAGLSGGRQPLRWHWQVGALWRASWASGWRNLSSLTMHCAALIELRLLLDPHPLLPSRSLPLSPSRAPQRPWHRQCWAQGRSAHCGRTSAGGWGQQDGLVQQPAASLTCLRGASGQ